MKQVGISGVSNFYGGIPVNTFTTDLSEAQSLQISARMPGLRSVERLQIMGQPDRWMMGHISIRTAGCRCRMISRNWIHHLEITPEPVEMAEEIQPVHRILTFS